MNGARTADDATGYAMSLMTATVSADTYMKAWASKSWISNLKDMPPAPYSMMDMYLVHQAMQDHALAVEAFGGIAGSKLGAVGVIPVGTPFPTLTMCREDSDSQVASFFRARLLYLRRFSNGLL